jgi:hypothetical protein
MINRIPEILAVIFLLMAIFLTIHQQLFSNDAWFNFQQLWHHETLIACFVFAAVALVLGKYLGRL